MTEPRRIYVASSWRNTFQPVVVQLLRAVPDFEVYDFKDADGFHWSEVAGEDWRSKGPEEYLEFIEHPRAVDGFNRDYTAMEWADTFVLVLPCGRSAHLELGWAVGQAKETAILLSDDGFEAELMYRMVDHIVTTPLDLLGALAVDDDDVEPARPVSLRELSAELDWPDPDELLKERRRRQ